MEVVGLGNVTGCNKSWIHINNNGEQKSIKANEERLREILRVAAENEVFYGRMWDEIKELYEREKEKVERRYHFITDEMIKEAFNRSQKEGLDLSWRKDSNNEECIRKYSGAFGIFTGARYASERGIEAHKLKEQAKGALGIKSYSF